MILEVEVYTTSTWGQFNRSGVMTKKHNIAFAHWEKPQNDHKITDQGKQWYLLPAKYSGKIGNMTYIYHWENRKRCHIIPGIHI